MYVCFYDVVEVVVADASVYDVYVFVADLTYLKGLSQSGGSETANLR